MKNRGRILKASTYFLLIAVLGIMSILTSCAGESTEPAPTATQTPAPTTAPAPAAAKATVCFSAEPDVLDPTSTKTGSISAFITRNMYDSLVEFDYDGKLKSTIATWEILNGGKCVEFKIRQGIKFTSGDPLTARDVEFSWMRTMDKTPQFKGDLRNFDHLQVVDDNTIRFYLTQPSAMFLTQNVGSCLIASKSYYDRVGEEEFVSKPVGSGPYKFAEWKRGQYIDLERNEDYWGQKPQVKQAHLVWSGEATTAVAMLKAGEIDLIVNAAWTSVPELEKLGFRAVKAPHMNYQLMFDMVNPNVPWANLKVRQAINYAIDKDAIINKVFYGIPSKIEWLSPGEVGYDPTLKPAYPYDLAKAKALLAEAGYPNGFEMPLYRGTLWGPSTADVVEYLTLALGEIGIKCKVTLVEGPAIVDLFRKAHSDPSVELTAVTGSSLCNSPDPIIGLSMMFLSTNPLGTYYTPELDVLINEGLATLDDTKRGEIIKQAYKIINDDLPVIPILAQNYVFMMKPNMDYKHRGKFPGTFYISEITVK
jgi:peptide/nickel transport system substrate-binding protein